MIKLETCKKNETSIKDKTWKTKKNEASMKDKTWKTKKNET